MWEETWNESPRCLSSICACVCVCAPRLAASRLRRTKLGVTLSLLCLKLLTVFNFTSYRARLCLSVSLCTVEATPGDKLCQALGWFIKFWFLWRTLMSRGWEEREGGRGCWRGEGGGGGWVMWGRKYVAGVSASSGHCSLSITGIVRYREAGEKREVGIYAEFPVFVVAAGLFFPSVPGQTSSIKSHLFGLEITNGVRDVGQFHQGLDPAPVNSYIFMLIFPVTPEWSSNLPSRSIR